jgi:hypothetical protein
MIISADLKLAKIHLNPLNGLTSGERETSKLLRSNKDERTWK